MRRSWKMWLIVLIALIALTEGVAWLLSAQGSVSVSRVVRVLGWLIADGWAIYGLIAWRDVPWVRRFGLRLLATAATAMLALMFWAMDWSDMVIATAGTYAMAIIFWAGLWLIRMLLSPGFAVCGIARALVDEAIHRKVSLAFIVIVAPSVALLPFVIDQNDFLKYRITSFLTWSLMIVSLNLSLMTVFLSVATITDDLRLREIFLTMTKPIGRGQYLLGKWLGITLLNLVLISVAGAGIYSFTKMLESQTARDDADRLAVRSQVLVARKAVDPTPPDPEAMEAMYMEHLERLRDNDPDRFGRPGDPPERVTLADRADIQQQVMGKWYTIANRSIGSYRFNGLGDAKQYNQPVQLRFKPKLAGSTPDGFLLMGVRVNGRIYPDPVSGEALLKLAERNFHVLDIHPRYIDQDGGMTVDIFNPIRDGKPQPSLNFNPKDGMQVLYRVGDFETNLVKTLVVIWLRLVFLAMLGLAAGTYLSFPVASLVCLLVFFTAAGSAYLTESMQYYAAFPKASLPLLDKIVWLINKVSVLFGKGEYYDLFKMLIKMIGSGFMLITPSFGRFNPTPLISDGRQIPTEMLVGAAIWSGVIWTGFVGLVGWVIFRGRELARVTV